MHDKVIVSLSVFITAVFVILCTPVNCGACTSFVLEEDGTVLLGKNLDWPVGDGFVIINSRGIRKDALTEDEAGGFSWEARNGSVTFNQFGRGFPLGGINEKGLAVEELSYSPSKYPSSRRHALNEFQWVQYQLDNFGTVEEVISGLKDITISPLIARLHYMVADRKGTVAIIEFIEGELKCYSGADIIVPVLTNNSYENSIEYLKKHSGFGGARAVTDGSESPERFVRAATLIKNRKEMRGSLLEKGIRILSSVRQIDTRWSIIYNLSEGRIDFRTDYTGGYRSIQLEDIDFGSGPGIFDLSSIIEGEENIIFEDYSVEKNSRLLREVLRKLAGMGEVPEGDANRIYDRLVRYNSGIQ